MPRWSAGNVSPLTARCHDWAARRETPMTVTWRTARAGQADCLGPRRRPRRLIGRIPPLGRFAAVRLLMLPLSVFVIITASFFLISLLPGDIARALLGPVATPTQIRRVNDSLGLNQPIVERYWHYLIGILHGSLVVSYYTRRTVVSEIARR